jgi:hypothetical protein
MTLHKSSHPQVSCYFIDALRSPPGNWLQLLSGKRAPRKGLRITGRFNSKRQKGDQDWLREFNVGNAVPNKSGNRLFVFQ